MYDWKGCWIEPDDDVPVLRRHCIRCGAFLPKEPKTVTKIVPVDWEYVYEQNELVGRIILSERQEEDWIWTCSRCQCQHDADEMFH